MGSLFYREFRDNGSYVVVAVTLATIGAFYGKAFLPFGVISAVLGAAAGLLWAMLIGFIARRLMRQARATRLLADTPVALAVIALGLMTGAGLMYGWMMAAALAESSATYALLSALMWPAVPFYIALNSAMELLIVALLVLWNWQINRRRRTLVLVAVAAYFVMRVWTYLVFAEIRLDIALRPLTASDVEWFKQTLAMDFRIALNLIAFVCLVLAAFVAPWPTPDRRAPAHLGLEFRHT
jgi:hypothetical protein